MDQFTSLALAVDQAADVISMPVVQMGEFVSSKHKFGSRVKIGRDRLDRIAANANSNVSGVGVMLDLSNDHSRGDSAGWMVPGSAKVAPFISPKTKREELGVWMDFKLNDTGKNVVDNLKRRFVSIDTQPYTDEQSQVTTADVPFAVALTNRPIIKSLPGLDAAQRIAAAEDDDDRSWLVLGEVLDEVTRQDGMDPPPELQTAGWSVYKATSAFESLVRKAMADGLTGEELKARIEELAADLPAAAIAAISEGVANANEATPATEVQPAVKQVDPVALAEDPEAAEATPDDEGKTPAEQAFEALDDAWQSLEALCKGGKGAPAMRQLHKEARQKAATILTPKGGTTQMAETDTELQLAELKATNERISAELKASRLDRIKDRVQRLPYDKATQEGLMLLAEASDGDTLALAEGDEVKNVPMIDYALALFENAQRVHIEVTSVEGPGALESGEALKLAESIPGIDSEKAAKVAARIEARRSADKG